MEPTEEDTVIKRTMSPPPGQVSKVLALTDALESVRGGTAVTLMKGDDWRARNQIGGGGKERSVLL